MSRYFIFLSYDGIPFNGWQIQKNTKNTVQQILEEKMGMILNKKIQLTGCGRTDTGVSAKKYVAHFDFEDFDLLQKNKHWMYKFNTVLPEEIAIHNIKKVNEKAHARYDVTSRTYYYNIIQKKNPFRNKYSWYLFGKLDFSLMNEASNILKEYSDFTSFSKLHRC